MVDPTFVLVLSVLISLLSVSAPRTRVTVLPGAQQSWSRAAKYSGQEDSSGETMLHSDQSSGGHQDFQSSRQNLGACGALPVLLFGVH